MSGRVKSLNRRPPRLPRDRQDAGCSRGLAAQDMRPGPERFGNLPVDIRARTAAGKDRGAGRLRPLRPQVRAAIEEERPGNRGKNLAPLQCYAQLTGSQEKLHALSSYFAPVPSRCFTQRRAAPAAPIPRFAEKGPANAVLGLRHGDCTKMGHHEISASCTSTRTLSVCRDLCQRSILGTSGWYPSSWQLVPRGRHRDGGHERRNVAHVQR